MSLKKKVNCSEIKDGFNKLLNMLDEYLSNHNVFSSNKIHIDDFYNLKLANEDNHMLFMKFVKALGNCLRRIKSNFFATTYDGIMIHFLGDNDFPDDVFKDKNEAKCKVYYDTQAINEKFKMTNFYLRIDKDILNTKFYFTPPRLLLAAVSSSYEGGLDEKEKIFKRLTLQRSINGIKRNLILKIDTDWLEELKRKSK